MLRRNKEVIMLKTFKGCRMGVKKSLRGQYGKACLYSILAFCLAFGQEPSKQDIELKRRIFEGLGVCKKVIYYDEYNNADIACIYNDEDGRECKRSINSFVEGNFSGFNRKELFLDIHDDCIPHVAFFGELWYVVEDKIVKKYDRLGEGVELIRFDTKSGKSLFIYKSSFVFQGVGDVYVGVCGLNPKNLKLKCKKIISGSFDVSGFNKFLKEFSIDKIELKDLNGDGQKDLVIKTTTSVYYTKNDKLVSKKTKVFRFIYDGKEFKKLKP